MSHIDLDLLVIQICLPLYMCLQSSVVFLFVILQKANLFRYFLDDSDDGKPI